MPRVKIYAEIEVLMDVDLGGLTEDAQEYEVQERKDEVYQSFQDALKKLFGEGFRKIDYFEFDVFRTSA